MPRPNSHVKGPGVPESSQTIRIGQILVEQGVLSEQQVFEIIEAQRRRGLPFGVLAEERFDVTIESIERAWIEQPRLEYPAVDEIFHVGTGPVLVQTGTPLAAR